MMKLFFITNLILILSLPSWLEGQYRNIRIDRISVEEGLDAHRVFSIIQDEKGFIWLGTNKGVYQYNGYSFRHITNAPNCRNNERDALGTVSALCQDESGIIWIFSENGIFLFDPESELSASFPGIVNDDIKLFYHWRSDADMLLDSKGTIWATGTTGLLKISLKEDSGNSISKETKILDPESSFDHDLIQLSTEGNSSKNIVQTIYEDYQGNLWIGCLDGVYIKRSAEEVFFRLTPWDELELDDQSRRILDFMETESGSMLVATTNGLYEIMNPDRLLSNSNTTDSQVIEMKHLLLSEYISEIYKTNSKDILIGTEYDLLYLDRKDETGSNSYTSLYQSLSESVNTDFVIGVNNLFEDRTGILWAGQSYYGLRKLNMRTSPFYTFATVIHDHFNITDVNTVYTDSPGNLWIGTFGDGLYHIDKDSKEVENHTPGPPSSDVICMHEIRPGVFWFGTGSGIIEFNMKTKEFRDPVPAGNIADNLRSVAAFSITNHENLIYVATFGGLFVFDTETNQLNQFTFNNDPSSWENMFTAVLKTRDGEIWTDTQTKGLFKVNYNSMSGEISLLPFSEHFINEVSVAHIASFLFEDSEGFIWRSQQANFSRINKETGEVTNYDLFAPFNTHSRLLARSVQEDNHSNLWIGTQLGLCKFNKETGQIQLFNQSDGLPILIHGHLSSYKNNDGTILFGGIGGFYGFHPDSIQLNEMVPEVFVTDFRLSNESVNTDHASDAILSKNIAYTDLIELDYDQNEFSFEFSALDFTDPKKNQYSYKLENYQDKWIETNASNRVATYTNLNPGTYVFRVKGSNNHGKWNEKIASIRIKIRPPWWKTIIAYIIYVLIIASSIGSFIYWRTRQLSNEKKLLEYEVNNRTAELKDVNRKLEEQKEEIKAQRDCLENSNRTIYELDRLKTRFFNNVSHEFRTLITLIKAPVETMMTDVKTTSKVMSNLEIINRNSLRLMSLVNQLLDISKIDRGKMKLKLVEDNVIHFIHSIAISFAPVAELNGIQFRFNVSREDKDVWFDEDKLEKIITNILSNAFKFTEEGGTVEMAAWLETHKEGYEEILVMSVSDTGQGIAEEDHQKIFDRFYQANEHLKQKGGGTGIGLALAKDLANIMHGSIEIHSEVNKGSVFTVELPVGKEHLEESEYSLLENPQKNNENENGILIPDVEHRGNIAGHLGNREPDGKPKLLIVEDNPDIRWFIAENMKSEFNVMEAVDGSAGLKLAAEQIPDLIITDLMMPRMDGLELCQRLKSDIQTSHIPVLLLTAKATLEDKLQGLEHGADDYIVKPFEIKELSARVRNMIEQRRVLREKFSNEIKLDPTDIVITPLDEKFLKKAISVVEANMNNQHFDVKSFRMEMNMTRSTCSRKLYALTNETPVEFIRTIRLKRAASLLKQNFGNVSEVALEVGFSNPSYFTRMFQRSYDVSPSDYAKSDGKV